MRTILLIMIVLGSTCQLHSQIQSQSMTLNGKVIDLEDNKNIDYFNIEIITDSTVVLQGSFLDGKFTFKLPGQKKHRLKISSMGYEDKIIDIDANGSTMDALICYMKKKTIDLDEVVVTALKPKISIKNNSYILSVDKTYLSNEASINNVITKLPFVLLDSNNKISISGKNNVVVYINNRKVLYTHELEVISPANIKDIQLISNPGSQYDADADAVIIINTKTNKQEGLELSLKTTETISNAFSCNVNPNININYGKINLYLDYVYSNNKGKSTENTLTNNLSNGYKNNIYNNGYYKSNNHAYTIGVDFPIKKGRLAFQLLGWNNRAKPEIKINNFYIKGMQESTIKTNRSPLSDEDHYDLSLLYEKEYLDIHKFNSSFNYTLHNNNSKEKITEYYSQDNILNHKYDFSGKNKAFDYQINYSLLIKKIELRLAMGTKISYVSNNSDSRFLENNIGWNNNFTYKCDFKEFIPAFFSNIEKKINNIDLFAGLRIENTHFKGNHAYTQVIDTTYINFFPSLGLNWAVNKNSKINFNYTRKISRPSFNNLSPNIRYDNVFFYRQGNPYLLPTITDDLSLSYSFKSIRLNAGYRHKKNATIYNYYQDTNNEGVTIVKLNNHKSIKFAYANVFYLFKSKNFTSSNSFIFTKPFAELAFNGKKIKLVRPAYYFKTSNDFILLKNISFYIDFLYNNLGETLLEKKEGMYNLSIGISGSFFDKKLILNIVANDILNTYKFKDHRLYGIYDVIHEYFPDNTYVQINARYNFSLGKLRRFKVQNNNSSIIRRL